MIRDVFPSELELAAALGRRVADRIRRQPRLVLGLPTGRTPIALYGELVRLTREEGLDWSAVRTFNLDEFVGLGADDRGSYRRFMADRLFGPVNLDPDHIEFLDGRAEDLDAECRRYERALRAAGGLDLLILGIGANGHIGFNEPGDALTAQTHVAVLDESSRAANTLWFDGDLHRVPRQALTMGMGTILQARAIVLVASGESKCDAVAAMTHGPVTTRVPASFLQLHPDVRVMLDEPLADCLGEA